MKKLVVKVDLCDDKQRSKAMKAVCGFQGIRSLNLDTKDNKLTVSGEFDPIKVVNKLKKSWHTEIVSIGPGKADDGKKDEGKKNEDQIANLIRGYQGFCPTPLPYSYEPYEDTRNCAIC